MTAALTLRNSPDVDFQQIIFNLKVFFRDLLAECFVFTKEEEAEAKKAALKRFQDDKIARDNRSGRVPIGKESPKMGPVNNDT